jgi:hypothetical protein
MERLTEHYEYPNGQHGYRAKGYGIIEQRPFFGIIKRLAEYEDAEEQGLLLRLPCKVGDTVYQIAPRENEIYPIVAPNLHTIVRWMEDEVIGEIIFLTRETAEAALKERQEGNGNG